MSYYLFDNPVYFYAAAAVAEVAAVLFYLNSQKQWRATVLLAGPLLALLGLGLDRMVETNREQMKALINKIVSASVKPEIPSMLGTLHHDINISGKDFDHLAAILKSYLSGKQLSSNTVKSVNIIDDSELGARAEFTALTVFDPQGDYAMAGMLTSKWQFDFKKASDGKLRISNMTMLSLAEGEPVNLFTDTKYR